MMPSARPRFGTIIFRAETRSAIDMNIYAAGTMTSARSGFRPYFVIRSSTDREDNAFQRGRKENGLKTFLAAESHLANSLYSITKLELWCIGETENEFLAVWSVNGFTVIIRILMVYLLQHHTEHQLSRREPFLISFIAASKAFLFSSLFFSCYFNMPQS